MASTKQTLTDDGPPADADVFYNVQSEDKKIMKISAGAARHSKLLVNLIDQLESKQTSESDVLTIPLAHVKAGTLKLIITWCEHYKDKAVKPATADNKRQSIVIPDWDQKLLKIDNEHLTDLTCAANYLDIDQLLEYCCKTIADMAKDKETDELRRLFAIPTDKQDEEADARQRKTVSRR